MSNKFSVPQKRVDRIFNFIKKDSGIKIKNLKSGTGYFVFDFGKNTVHHFRVKGLRGWKFGLWIRRVEDNKFYAVSFFGEHKWFMDKFKPTATTIHIEKDIERKTLDRDDLYDWNTLSFMYAVRDKINSLKSFGVFNIPMVYGSSAWKSISPIPWLIGRWWSNEIAKRDYEFKRNQLNHLALILIRIFLKMRYSKRKLDIGVIVDGNSDGWICSPRYTMDIKFTDEFDPLAKKVWKILDPIRFNWLKNVCFYFIPVDVNGNIGRPVYWKD